MKRTCCCLVVGLSCLFLFSASPVWADTTVSTVFTNHTGVSVNDFHYDLNGLYNVISTNVAQDGNVFQSEATTQDATDTYLDFTNGVVGNGQSATIAVTVGGNSWSARSANWTLGGVYAGNAYAPMSYAGNPATAQQWVITLDNKDIPSAGRLLVSNLKFAVTTTEFNASTITTNGLSFGPPESPFIIEPGDYTTFTVPTSGPSDPFVVADWDINYVDSGGNIIPYTEGHFTAEATPEPATLSLLALGGLAILRSRRQKR